MYDYQGRSYLHIPQDVGINLRSSDVPDKCYLPKKQIHVWSGHTKVSGNEQLIPCQRWSRKLIKCHQKLTTSSCLSRVSVPSGFFLARLISYFLAPWTVRSRWVILTCSWKKIPETAAWIYLYSVFTSIWFLSLIRRLPVYMFQFFAAAMLQCCVKKFPLSLSSFGKCTRSGDAYGHLLVSNLNFLMLSLWGCFNSWDGWKQAFLLWICSSGPESTWK